MIRESAAISLQQTLKLVVAPVHPEGWPFIAISILATIMMALIDVSVGWIGAIITGWCVYFFRDPERVTPSRPGLVVSPGDGRVVSIAAALPPEEIGMGSEPRTRIGIFLSTFDVHVNRVPADGVVKSLAYRPGRFINASLDKASEANERMAVRLVLADGRDLAFVQVAGLIARRILCTLAEGQTVRSGERYGMIRFGSRVDLYLPTGVAPLVVVGQRVIGGETVLADLTSGEPARTGEVR